MAEHSEKVPVKRGQGSSSELAERLSPYFGLRDEIDQLFEDFADMWAMGPFRGRGRGFGRAMRPMLSRAMQMPAIDVVEKEKDILIRAELPGMDENDIDVRLTDGALSISGEKKEERKEGEEEGEHYMSECSYGYFHRMLPLPEGIAHDKITASFRNGVLTVDLPKTPEAQEKSRKIEVKAEH